MIYIPLRNFMLIGCSDYHSSYRPSERGADHASDIYSTDVKVESGRLQTLSKAIFDLADP